MNISLCVAGCIKKLERLDYLKLTVNTTLSHFPDAELLIGLDNTPDEQTEAVKRLYPQAKVKSHTDGLGASWNWCIQNATNETILQTEEDWAVGALYFKDRDNDLKEKVLYADKLIHQNNKWAVRLDNMAHDWYRDSLRQCLPPHMREAENGYHLHEHDDEFTHKNVFELHKVANPKYWYAGWNPYFLSNHPQVKHKKFHDHIGWYMEKATFQVLVKSGALPANELIPQTEFDMGKKTIYNKDCRVFFFKESTYVHTGTTCVRQ